MTEAYLFKNKNIFDRIKKLVTKNPNNNNYTIYIPNKSIVVGYFSNDELDPSKEKFYRIISNKKERSKLRKKIKEDKFIKKIYIGNHSLEALTSSYKTFEVCFENIPKNTKDEED